MKGYGYEKENKYKTMRTYEPKTFKVDVRGVELSIRFYTNGSYAWLNKEGQWRSIPKELAEALIKHYETNTKTNNK